MDDPGHDFSLSVDELVGLLVYFLDAAVHVNLFDYDALVDCIVRSIWIVVHIEILEFVHLLACFRRRGCEQSVCGIRSGSCALHAQFAITVCVQASSGSRKLRRGRYRGPVVSVSN